MTPVAHRPLLCHASASAAQQGARGRPSHQENSSVPSSQPHRMQRESMGSEKPPLAPSTPFLLPVSSCDSLTERGAKGQGGQPRAGGSSAAPCENPVPCAQGTAPQPEIRPPAATQTSRWQPHGDAAGRPPSSSGAQLSLLVCVQEGSTALPAPAALPVLTSQGGVGALSPRGGQRPAAGPYLQTKPSVRKILENTAVTLDYSLECVTLSGPQS